VGLASGTSLNFSSCGHVEVSVGRSLGAALGAGAITTVMMLPAYAAEPYLDAVVDAWTRSDVYVDDSQHLLMAADEASRLAERVDGNRPPIRIAVVPAVALSELPGGTDHGRAIAFLEEGTDRLGRDGHYFVVFGGTGVYSATIAVDPPAEDALVGQLGNFTRGEPAALLHAVLDDLGVPALLEDAAVEPASLWPFAIVGVAVVGVLAGGFLWWRIRRVGGHGPSLYHPSFETTSDDRSTLASRRALAREDLIRLGEEISRADLPLDDPAVASDVRAAMDAYTQVGSAVDDQPDDLVLRAVQATSEYGRWRLACGRARVSGQPLPPRRADCFFDARHGVSVTDWTYTPANGVVRDVPVCAGCRDTRAKAAR
jgi:hypothetical protein